MSDDTKSIAQLEDELADIERRISDVERRNAKWWARARGVDVDDVDGTRTDRP